MIIKCYSGGKVIKRFQVTPSETLGYSYSDKDGYVYVMARNNIQESWVYIYRWHGNFSIEFDNLNQLLKRGLNGKV